MQSSASNQGDKPPHNKFSQNTCIPPSLSRGLKRMEGTSKLKPIKPHSPFKKQQTAVPSSFLPHSTSTMNIKFDTTIYSSTATTQEMNFKNAEDRDRSVFIKPTLSAGLTRTKTSLLPLKNNYQNDKRGVPIKIHQDDPKITPIRFKVERTPGGTISKATIIPKIPQTKNLEKPPNNDQFTPPMIRRSSSGSMLLRQTPERVRRQEEESGTSPTKRMRRSGSMPKSVCREVSPIKEQLNITPVLKRKRTSSLTSLSSGMPKLTPQRLRPRGVSESRTDDDRPTAVRTLMISPIKKRNRPDSESRPTSPMKKRYISSYTLGGNEDVTQTPISTTPMRKIKSTIFNPKAVTERIAQTYGAGISHLNVTENFPVSTANNGPPELVTRSTSGDTYYTATEGDISIPLESLNEKIGVPLPTNSFSSSVVMVPLVKKQMSIDEKILEDEEDEGFGDSMKTIKRGQGSHLARSVSLKLSPRTDPPKSIGADTEKSCSTPSLPTAPLIRQSSTSSLRFKVSPSTFLKPLNTTPINTPLPQPVVQTSKVELSEPSTSRMGAEIEQKSAIKKSALKKTPTSFTIKDDQLHGFRRRKLKFSGLNVHYFDRRQGGESTVPTEGDVSLDMHNTHHTHRYFSLSSGKRPLLDLALYEDGELSDGEVIDPDSDGEREYDEYASAKTINRIDQRLRIRLLKKSGIKIEKNPLEAEFLRATRKKCGCSCINGVCLPETCECAIEGINCQVDGCDYSSVPCACFAETCTNPQGRIYYDPEAVHQFRQRTIMNWQAGQKSGMSGSPVLKKFADSDEDEDVNKSKNWLLQKAIPIKLEESPTKYPVTPVYTRRSRSSLSDIRESTSELSSSLTPSTSLSERMKAMQHLENEVCVEQEEKECEVDKEETIIECDATLQEAYVPDEVVEADVDAELLEAALSPVKTTVVA